MLTEDDLLLSWLDDPAADRGARFYLGDGQWQRLAYPELARRVFGAAEEFRDSGVRHGDLVPVVAQTSPGFVAALYGLFLIGATPGLLPTPWALQDQDAYLGYLAAVAAQIRPRFAVADEASISVVTGAGASAGLAPRVLALPDAESDVTARPDPAELALLQFTSGSRGSPRGLRITAAGVRCNIAMIHSWLRVHGNAVASWLPLYHDMGLIGCLLTPTATQAEQAHMRPEQFLRDPLAWLKMYGQDAFEIITMPGFGFDVVNRKVARSDLERMDFSALRAVISGAERVDPAALSSFAALLAPYGFDPRAFTPAYGLAEATLAVTGVPTGRSPHMVRIGTGPRRLGDKVVIHEEREIGTKPPDLPWQWQVGCGAPLGDAAVRLTDEAGRDVPDDVLGEIVVRGPSVADGYTRISPGDVTRFSDGELLTGDAGFWHGGELYVLGRLGDSVKVHGRTLFVEDIERGLSSRIQSRRGRLTVAGGTEEGVPTILVLMDIDADGDRVADMVAATAGGGVRVVVIRLARGAIPFTSSGKPRRQVAWTRYIASELKGTEISRRSPDHSPTPNQEMPL